MAFLDKAGLERLWEHIVSLVGTKVEKVEGKGLSTEDFTTEEKEKLAGLGSVILSITPSDFGAKGDGTTDDTSSLQAFFNSEGNKELECNKIYACGTIVISKNITLNGNGSKIMKAYGGESQPLLRIINENEDVDATFNDCIFETAAGQGGTLVAFRGNDLRLQGCSFIKGNGTKGGWCTDINCRDVYIDNCYFDSQFGVETSDGIHLRKAKNAFITNCNINTMDDCIAPYQQDLNNDGVYLGGDIENVFVSNCLLRANQFSCFKIGHHANVPYKVGKIYVENCKMFNSDRFVTMVNQNPDTESDTVLIFNNCDFICESTMTSPFHFANGYGNLQLSIINSIIDAKNTTSTLMSVRDCSEVKISNSTLNDVTGRIVYSESQCDCSVVFNNNIIKTTKDMSSGIISMATVKDIVLQDNIFIGANGETVVNASFTPPALIKNNHFKNSVLNIGSGTAISMFNTYDSKGNIVVSYKQKQMDEKNIITSKSVTDGTITPTKTITITIDGSDYKIGAVSV